MINRKIDGLVMSWDSSDKFGSAMAWSFGAADALELAGEFIPMDWQYLPGANGPSPSFESDMITDAVTDGLVTWEDVRHLGNALLRYRAILETKGETY